jgi:NAD(P)-dependent dehydrogenase (short-subunit alcohol dehydrogenase family)
MPARKRMIITGVSSGIGLAVAAEALRLGWHVEGIGRNAPTLLTEHSRGAFTRCDLSDRASLKGLFIGF